MTMTKRNYKQEVELLEKENEELYDQLDIAMDCIADMQEEHEILVDALHAAVQVTDAPLEDIFRRLKLKWTHDAREYDE
jgi:hypothetical protein